MKLSLAGCVGFVFEVSLAGGLGSFSPFGSRRLGFVFDVLLAGVVGFVFESLAGCLRYVCVVVGIFDEIIVARDLVGQVVGAEHDIGQVAVIRETVRIGKAELTGKGEIFGRAEPTGTVELSEYPCGDGRVPGIRVDLVRRHQRGVAADVRLGSVRSILV